MSVKRINQSQSQFVTPAFLSEQLDRQAEKIFEFIKQQRTLIEARMDFYRKDAKEQINSLASSLAKTTAELHGRMDRIEVKIDLVADTFGCHVDQRHRQEFGNSLYRASALSV